MAIAEHEIIQQEVTQSVTVRLTEAQAAALRQAAEAKGQSMEEFAAAIIKGATETALVPDHAQIVLPAKSFASVLGIFRDEPLMEALMERIHAERLAQAAGQDESETDTVLFTSYDGTSREVGALPANLGRATALANEKAAGKIWGTPEEEAACHAMQKEK